MTHERTRTILLFVLFACLCCAAFAGDVQIIANPGVSASSISPEDLKSVFLMTKTSLGDGSRIEPVLAKAGAPHQAFLKTYIGRTDTALETYYRSLVFTGKGSMPKMLTGDAAVMAYVAKTKGAIGYVSSGANPVGVKKLEVQ